MKQAILKKLQSYDGSEKGGVDGYEFNDEGIILRFKDGRTYLYSNKRPGKVHVNNMKELAEWKQLDYLCK